MDCLYVYAEERLACHLNKCTVRVASSRVSLLTWKVLSNLIAETRVYDIPGVPPPAPFSFCRETLELPSMPSRGALSVRTSSTFMINFCCMNMKLDGRNCFMLFSGYKQTDGDVGFHRFNKNVCTFSIILREHENFMDSLSILEK